MDELTALLHRAVCAVEAAARACRNWEEGGEVGPVSDTAWKVDKATLEAVEAVQGIHPAFRCDSVPESRAGRLILAARLLALAGTDEDGQSDDLVMAAKVLSAAGKIYPVTVDALSPSECHPTC